MARGGIALVAAALLLAAAPARAQDIKTRVAARELGAEGIKLYDAGKYPEALDRFDRANKLVPAPTLEVRIARSLVKLGRLVEASESYLEAVRFKNEPTSPPAYYQAEKEAQTERDLLMPRIPKLRVLVGGPMTDRTVVLLDGKPMPLELLDTLVPVDPGTHEVRVRRDDVTVTARAMVTESSNARAEVQLPELPEKRLAEHSAKESTWRAATISAFAVGGAGLVAFAVNGGIALKQKSDLDASCPDRNCAPDAFAELDAYNATRIATTVGLVIGGAGVIAGTTLLFLRPKKPDLPGDHAARLEPWIGPGGSGARIVW